MANRYWVGGGSSDNWDATTPTNWSATSGGSNDAGVPVSADNVFFDANSGSGNSIISDDITIRSLDCTGYVGTLTHNAVTLTIGANTLVEEPFTILFSSGMTYLTDAVSALFIAGSNSYDVTSNGKVLPQITNGSGVNIVSLMDDLSAASISSNSILNTNGNNITTDSLDITNFAAIISNSTIKQTVFNTSSPIYGENAGSFGQAVGQSFTATSTTLKHVLLFIQKVGTISDNLTVEVATTIDGVALGSATITPFTNGSFFTLNKFTFASAVSLTIGVKYFVRVIKSTGSFDTTNYYQALRLSFSNYSGGEVWRLNTSGWDALASSDLWFAFLADDATTSTYTLEGTGNVWDVDGAIFETTTPNIKLTDSSTSSKTFNGGGFQYTELWNDTGGTGVVNVNGSNTITTLKSAANRDFVFEAGTTQTVTNVEIGEGNQLYSSISGNTWTISDTTGTNTVENATIKDSVATGGATWKNISGTDDGNNTGWVFIDFATLDTDPATDILETTATLNGEIVSTNNSSVTRRGFVIGTSSLANPGDVSPEVSSYATVITETGTFNAGAFTGSATGQTRETTYYYRAFAENEAGFSYGPEVSYTTDGLPAVSLVDIDVTDAIAVVATGTISDTNGDNVVRRGFVVSTTPQSDPGDVTPEDSTYTNITSQSGSFIIGNFSLGVTSLDAATTYYIRAFAENGVGHTYSAESSFVTRNRPTVALPQVTDRESTTVDILSEVTDSDGLLLSDRGVVYSESTQTNPGNVAPGDSLYTSVINQSGTFSVGTFTSNITSLNQNTRYYLRSYARNNGGYTYSDEINFRTRVFPGGKTIDNQDTSGVTPTNNVVFGVAVTNPATSPVTPANRNTSTSAIINTNTANSTITNL